MNTKQLDAIASKIKSSEDLWDLHEALVEFETVANTDDDGVENTGRYRDADTEGLLAQRGIDLCDLPSFGGPVPRGEGIWSHDEGHILAGEGPFQDWEIRERA